MIFETKEDFIKHYESLSDDFDKKVFLQEYIEACEKGDIDSLANEPDRLTADETNFKIYFPRYTKRLNPEDQAQIDKNFEDAWDEMLLELDTEVDFQLDNLIQN